MNIDRVIESFVEFYPDRSYTFIAQMIINAGLNEGLAHRTLRRKVGEYVENLLDEESDTLSAEYLEATDDYEDEPIADDSYGEMEPEESIGTYLANRLGLEDYDLVEQAEIEADIDNILKGYLDNNGHTNHTNNYAPIQRIINERHKNYIVVGCVHFPFHNKDFWNAFLSFVEDFASYGLLDGIILDGDILDMHSISRHSKGKITIPGLTLEEEYRLSNIELDRLDVALSRSPFPVEKHYLYGNHEMWYYDYMTGVDAHKLGQGVIKSPMEALELRERGYRVQTNYKTAYVMLGDMEIHHGTYVNRHAAHAHANAMRRSNAFAHTHRIGSYLEDGIECFNIGWMGDKDQRVFGYMDRIQKETWKNGFAQVTVDEDDKSHLTQLIWKNGRFFFGGKEYR